MKKIKIIMLISVCILFLSACIDNTKNKNQDIEKNNIISVEIGESDNLNYNSEFFRGIKSNNSDEYEFKKKSDLISDEKKNGYIIDLTLSSPDLNSEALKDKSGKIIFCACSKEEVAKIVTADIQYTVISYNEENIGKQTAKFINAISVNKPNINILNVYGIQDSINDSKEIKAYNDELSKNSKAAILENLKLNNDSAAYKVLKEKILSYKKIDIIYVRNPDMAVAVSKILEEIEKTEISVISGFITDNVISEIESGDITAGISRIPYHLGKIAGENMIKLINNEKVDDIVLDCTFVTKDNTSSIKIID